MRHSKLFRWAAIGLTTVLILTLALGSYSQISKAVEVPDPGPLQIQTSGPNTPLLIGDWYSHVTGDNTYHLLIIPVPDTYPTTQDITVRLFDPECYNAPGDPRYDEIRDAADDNSDDMANATTTTYRLLAPDGVTVIQNTTYDPVAATDQQWVVFATFRTETYGSGNYELHITTGDNDDNTWRIRIDPDDPDGIPNGNEIGTPFMRITYQFFPPPDPPYDHTFWFYVPNDWALPTVTLHNFDFDFDLDPGDSLMTSDASITYVAPSGTAYAGTLSGHTGWNDGVANGGASPNRAGDNVPTEFGWWQMQVRGFYDDNQILVEAGDLPMYTDRPTQLAANVGLTKSRTTPSPVPVGETVSFDVTLTNTGLTPIITLPLEDTYDSTYLDFQSASPAPDFVDEATGTLRWNNLAPSSGLVPDQSVTVTLNFTALASTAGGVTVNTATVSGAQDDNENELPQQEASDNVIIVAASFALSKVRTTASSVPIGEAVSFDVTIVNTGDTGITVLPLEDTYDPTYLDYQSASPAPDFVDETMGTLRWNNLASSGTLLPGGSVVVTLNFTALASTAGGVTVNSATVSEAMDENEQLLPEQTASDNVTIVTADFGLSKVRTTASPVPVGGAVSFDVTIVNTGQTGISLLPLNDTYDPAYLDYQSASPAPDFVDETMGTLRWNNLAPSGGLLPGGSVVVTLNFTALASTDGGVTVNSATVSEAMDENEQLLPEQTASDNVTIVTADFGLSKVRTTASPVPVGEAVSFDVTIVNTGQTGISVLPLDDTYDPAYLDYQSASPAPDSVDETTGTLHWNNLAPSGGLLPGGSVVVTLNFTALASTGELPGGVTVNTATVSGAQDDSGLQLSEQTANDNVSIVAENIPEPRITKSGDPSQALIGDHVTFTLVARNYGNVAATGVQVTDQIESYLDIFQVTASKGTVSWDNASRLVVVDIGTLAPDEAVTITIETVVNETATPTPLIIENQAHLTFNEGNQRDSEIVTIEIISTLPPEPEPPAPAAPPSEIPEPLTLFLLGGGLASLAGYATLRRRTQ
jgi:uncharacterized repeat protein (TIGR01451 family)